MRSTCFGPFVPFYATLPILLKRLSTLTFAFKAFSIYKVKKKPAVQQNEDRYKLHFDHFNVFHHLSLTDIFLLHVPVCFNPSPLFKAMHTINEPLLVQCLGNSIVSAFSAMENLIGSAERQEGGSL